MIRNVFFVAHVSNHNAYNLLLFCREIVIWPELMSWLDKFEVVNSNFLFFTLTNPQKMTIFIVAQNWFGPYWFFFLCWNLQPYESFFMSFKVISPMGIFTRKHWEMCLKFWTLMNVFHIKGMESSEITSCTTKLERRASNL